MFLPFVHGVVDHHLAGRGLLCVFAGKLSRQPWRMSPADLQALRNAGYPEPALLHAISVVALQNAESRLAMGYALSSSRSRHATER